MYRYTLQHARFLRWAPTRHSMPSARAGRHSMKWGWGLLGSCQQRGTDGVDRGHRLTFSFPLHRRWPLRGRRWLARVAGPSRGAHTNKNVCVWAPVGGVAFTFYIFTSFPGIDSLTGSAIIISGCHMIQCTGDDCIACGTPPRPTMLLPCSNQFVWHLQCSKTFPCIHPSPTFHSFSRSHTRSTCLLSHRSSAPVVCTGQAVVVGGVRRARAGAVRPHTLPAAHR